jgi:pyrroloquinoline quinone biosynthesis protein D
VNEAFAPVHDWKPRLAPGVRLHLDAVREAWVLLAPERIIETEGPVHDIVRRCDGTRTVADIVQELAALYAAPAEDIAVDVADLLRDLKQNRLIVG